MPKLDDDTVIETNDEVNEFLNMSDEDMINQGAPSLASAPAEKEESVVEADDKGEVAETDEEKAAALAATKALESDDVDDKGEPNVDTTADDKAAKDAATKVTADKTTADKPVDDADADKAKPAEVSKAEVVDFEAAYKKITAPFTANGKQIQVNSIDDAISLMQMGANYNKKMAGLKPGMKLLKMLEANGLMDESQIGFLIDLHKRDPAAINKLVMDSKLDPLDLNTDKANEYKPGAHKVDDREMELDTVLDEIKDSPNYNRTLQVVSTDWDAASKSTIVANPQVLKKINIDITSGVFDIVKAEMDNERTFGRLSGLSDIQAYQKVGEAINARGGFNHLTKGSSQQKTETPPPAKVIVAPIPKQEDDDKLKAARKAASGTKAAAGAKGVPADFNPLSMSDADFAKFK